MLRTSLLLLLTSALVSSTRADDDSVTPEEVLRGLRDFYAKTARPDGSFAPGIDPEYIGMSDCAYSDLAAVTYACTVHKTFGWELPYEQATIRFLQSRQRPDGSFFNVAGTVDPQSAPGKTYNTTQGLVAQHALGAKPLYDPLPIFEEILRADYQTLPPYSTSFFPLAYLCAGRPIPAKADRGIRALMVQDESGYLNSHIAATFHASHYYSLVGEETPKSEEMVARVLREQNVDGSWLLNLPSRDRHATFDAVFTLKHEGQGSEKCRAAIARAQWAVSCRNADGGFGHFPGSTSDADAIYFQVGTLVMAGFLAPVEPLPKDPHLLSWGHLMPVRTGARGRAVRSLHHPGWVGGVAFSPDGKLLATACADHDARLFHVSSGKEMQTLQGHENGVQSVAFSPDGKRLATGGYDHRAMVWDVQTGKLLRTLTGHEGVVMSVAFAPEGNTLATGSVDRTIRLWDLGTGEVSRSLQGHRSWVNSIQFSGDGEQLCSGSSDGTVRVWSVSSGETLRELAVSQAEVRAVSISADGKHLAAGIRYGEVKVWDTGTWREVFSVDAHDGDVWSLRFTADGERLVTSGGDWNSPGMVRLWNVTDGEAVGGLQHTGEVLAVDVSADGKRIAAGAGDHTVKVWGDGGRRFR